jgi:hypothetical protein
MNDEAIIFSLLCLALAIDASAFCLMKLGHQTYAPIQTCVFVWHVINLSCAYLPHGSELSQLAIPGPSLSLLLSSTLFIKKTLGSDIKACHRHQLIPGHAGSSSTVSTSNIT